MQDPCSMLTEDFLKNSWSCVKAIVEKVSKFQGIRGGSSVSLFRFTKGIRTEKTFARSYFFLRGSVEYTNPQLTVEEVQGVIGTRMLEVCGNYFLEYGLRSPHRTDITEICERLKKPLPGPIVPFLLNTDDTEPDRYSMNPLKESIVSSGQSAFPAATVKTEKLCIDRNFIEKYDGTLISKGEADSIADSLANSDESYLDFVDSHKFAQLEMLSPVFGIDLSICALRMPVTTLQSETQDGLLHHIISETHRDFETIKQTYDCMGRSITNRTTLLTIPHSKSGYGSKRAARGKLRFSNSKLDNLSITYKTTLLYPNAIDENDVSIAKAEDKFMINGKQLTEYDFHETPSSPQFFLYSLGSPENAALWHGIGAFAAPQLLRSYVAARGSCREGRMIKNLQDYGVSLETPMQFNLAPEKMWVHPTQRNIDASIGCVTNIMDLAHMGMKIEHLSRLE